MKEDAGSGERAERSSDRRTRDAADRSARARSEACSRSSHGQGVSPLEVGRGGRKDVLASWARYAVGKRLRTRRRARKPVKPEPRSSSVPGSGTGVIGSPSVIGSETRAPVLSPLASTKRTLIDARSAPLSSAPLTSMSKIQVSSAPLRKAPVALLSFHAAHSKPLPLPVQPFALRPPSTLVHTPTPPGAETSDAASVSDETFTAMSSIRTPPPL